jgi:type I restriction enzyme S subunit
MAVKKGYKQTEVGVIPEDWDCAQIGQLATTSSGTTPSRSSYDRYFKNGSINWVKTLDLNNGIVAKTDERVTAKALDETSLSVFPTGTVLVAMYGGFMQIGRTGILAIPACVNQALTAIKCNIADLKPAYLLWVLNHRVEYWKSVASSSRKDPNITSKEIREFPIPLPPTLAEQEAIAGALSDADAWIESLEQLIAKKRQIKQGAMQELLTGKRRLPGFSGEWEETTLGELATFLSGGTPSRNNDGFWTGDIPWISASSLRCFEIWRSDSNVTKEAVVSGSKIAPVGSSLLLVRGSALHKEILCGLVIKPVCFNQDVKALVPYSQVVPRFLTMLIRGMADAMLKLVSSAGNTAGVLDTKLLKAFAIRLPTPNEQTAIATVLSDMDTEIGSLESKLAKAREIKQGMMQELLTGKIRLVKSSAVSANPQEMSHDR